MNEQAFLDPSRDKACLPADDLKAVMRDYAIAVP